MKMKIMTRGNSKEQFTAGNLHSPQMTNSNFAEGVDKEEHSIVLGIDQRD